LEASVILSIFIRLILVPYMSVVHNLITYIIIIIALGILVDNSIVVNDNIERRLVEGDSKMDAMYNGVKEVAPSVIASTIAIVLAFSPLFFLSGDNGDFIRVIPIILITKMFLTTVLAIIFVPLLTSII